MTDEDKKKKQAEYQRTYRNKLKMAKMQLNLLNKGVNVNVGTVAPTKFEADTLVSVMNELNNARLMIHQAAVIFAEARYFGINEEAMNAFITSAQDHINAVETRPLDVKMMYPAAKKISDIIMASNGFAPIS